MIILPNPSAFALAGDATFSLRNTTTGALHTYRVRFSEPMLFIDVAVAPNDWRYLGFVRAGVYFHGGAKAKITREAPSAKAFHWFFVNMARHIELPPCAA